MTPFEPSGPTIPEAPFDLPTPDIPAANFQAIGAQMEAGRRSEAAKDDGPPAWFTWIGALVGLILGTILGWIGRIIAALIGVWFQIFHAAETGTDEISAQAIGGMFGVGVPVDAFKDITGWAARGPTMDQISKVVLEGLFPGATTGAPGGIGPGHAGADSFIKLSTRMAVEGWLQGWVFELSSAGQVETFAELKDIMERSLGIGRLMRRVLSAPMKILLQDPFTWELNAKYRPTQLAPDLMVRQYLRGLITRSDLDTLMGYHGYSNDKIEALINYNRLHLSSANLLTLELHSNRSQADTVNALKAQGYDDDTATALRFVELQARLDAWNMKVIDELAAAVEARRADIHTLDDFMEQAGIPATEKALIRLHVENRLAHNRTLFSVSEGQQLVEKGIWDLNQFRELARTHGYSDSDETDLELLLLGKIKDASDAATKRAAAVKAKQDTAAARAAAIAAKAAAALATAEAHGLSIAKYETLVKDGLRGIPEYRAFLLSKGIAADNVTALVTVLQSAADKAAAAAGVKAHAAGAVKAKNLSLAQLDSAVKAGAITLVEYAARLKESGVSDVDAAILIDVLTEQINAAKDKAKHLADAKAAAAVRHVDLSQEVRAVRVGLASLADYAAFLAAHGFAPEDATLLVGELKAQVDADTAARGARAAVAAALKKRGLSLTQLERSVRAGLSTIADYRQALAAAGYDAAAQDDLVSLLQLQLDQDQATLVLKGQAAALLGARGVSLIDLERAVKLGVVSISVYTDALARAGIKGDAANVLTLSLAAAAKLSKAAAGTAANASKLLAAAGLTLATLEKDVLAGRLQISQLEGMLRSAGVDAADIADIVGLLQDELDNAAAARALVAGAAAKAAAKYLDLSQETAAVKAGVKTIVQFEAFVASLGYDPADVATLEATLSAQLGAAAGKKTPAPKTPARPPAPA